MSGLSSAAVPHPTDSVSSLPTTHTFFLRVNLLLKCGSWTFPLAHLYHLFLFATLLPLGCCLLFVLSIEHSEEDTARLLRGSRGHEGAPRPGGGRQPPDHPSQRRLPLPRPLAAPHTSLHPHSLFSLWEHTALTAAGSRFHLPFTQPRRADHIIPSIQSP